MKIWRIGDEIAITPPDGPTFYLSTGQATQFLGVVDRVINDVSSKRFADSNIGTFSLEYPRTQQGDDK